MPWTSKDVGRHNRGVKSSTGKRQWADVANSVLRRTGNEGRAIREANAVAKKRRGRRSGRR